MQQIIIIQFSVKCNLKFVICTYKGEWESFKLYAGNKKIDLTPFEEEKVFFLILRLKASAMLVYWLRFRSRITSLGKTVYKLRSRGLFDRLHFDVCFWLFVQGSYLNDVTLLLLSHILLILDFHSDRNMKRMMNIGGCSEQDHHNKPIKSNIFSRWKKRKLFCF